MLKMSSNMKKQANGFKIATDDDLDDGVSVPVKNNTMYEYNKMESSSDKQLSSEDIELYLKMHTSGTEYSPKDGEMITDGGDIILPFYRVKEMVEDGYNIIKSQLIGGELCEIVYQRIQKIEKGMVK